MGVTTQSKAMAQRLLSVLLALSLATLGSSFVRVDHCYHRRSNAVVLPTTATPTPTPMRLTSSFALSMAQVSQQEAQKGIDRVVQTLRKDASANKELGRLDKVTNVLGYGSPTPGAVAVRFNASFKKGGFGLSSVPLPFGLGQSNESEGRGQMIGQVKASVDSKTGKVMSCSVFRDLGYGRSFELKC